MLGTESALAVEQTQPAALTQGSHHGEGRMRHVGVERRAEEGEPAGHRRLYVGPKAKRPPRHLGHAGKAAIQLDGVEFFAVTLDEVHDGLQNRVLRVTFVELVANKI